MARALPAATAPAPYRPGLRIVPMAIIVNSYHVVHNPRVDVHQLRVFSSVFRNRSFSRAADELRLTQPTVSEHIADLERQLGARLFDRAGRSIHPTPEADVLFARAQEIVELLAAVPDAIARSRRELSGQITIGASSIPGAYILPAAIAAFRRLHPGVSFVVRAGDSREIADLVLAHALTVGIVGSRIVRGHLHYRPLMEDELVVVVPPSGWAEATTLRRLAQRPAVLREEGSGTRREAERILQAAGVDPARLAVAAVLGSTDAIKQGVKAGLGWSVVSRRAVEEEISGGSLHVVPVAARMRRSFHAVTHTRRSLPSACEAFLEHLAPRQGGA
jgi:DNA-binding transcriptional LysR family regulator